VAVKPLRCHFCRFVLTRYVSVTSATCSDCQGARVRVCRGCASEKRKFHGRVTTSGSVPLDRWAEA
jgi:hypothetical protein